MFSKEELIDAINELEEGRHSIQNCEKLAAIYTVLDHLYPEELKSYSAGYSGASKEVETIVGDYGDTQFLSAIRSQKSEDMWLLMDELMSTIAVVNPRLYDGVMRKI